MSKLLPSLVLLAGIASITTMQINALNHGVNGTVYTMSVVTVGGLVAGFCGFKLKDVLDWWRDK